MELQAEEMSTDLKSSSSDTQDLVAEALQILRKPPRPHPLLSKSESSVNFNPFTNSEDLKVRSSDVKDHSHRLKPQYTPHKRNVIQNVAEVVKPENGFDEHVDDCYSWNKWWQRNILGSKYLRSYYHCAHRKTQGCLATKQVQRHPSVLEIRYSGKHTCTQAIEFDQLGMHNMKFGHVINTSNSMLLPILSSTPESSEGENCSEGEGYLPILTHYNEGHSVTNLKTLDTSYMSVPRVRTRSHGSSQ